MSSRGKVGESYHFEEKQMVPPQPVPPVEEETVRWVGK